MLQPIALGPGKLGLARGHQQKKIDLSYLDLAIQPRLATQEDEWSSSKDELA